MTCVIRMMPGFNIEAKEDPKDVAQLSEMGTDRLVPVHEIKLMPKPGESDTFLRYINPRYIISVR